MSVKRLTVYCDTCEQTVYAADVHSCWDAKAMRAQEERERALTVAEREELTQLRAEVAAMRAMLDAWVDTPIGDGEADEQLALEYRAYRTATAPQENDAKA